MVTVQTEWEQFPENFGSLGIPRASMPQIKSEHRGALVQFLKGRGITHQVEDVLPSSLKPSQAEFSPAKVETARTHAGPQRSILISSDDHVLDGHHQWLSDFAASDKPQPAIRLNAPIQTLLLEASQFPSSFTDGAGTDAQQATAGDDLLDEKDFAARIRQKHPGVYDSLDDAELTRRVIEKYPEYKSRVRSNAQTFDTGGGVSVSVKPPAGMSVTMTKEGLWNDEEIEPARAPSGQGVWGMVTNEQPDLMDEKQFAAKIRAKHPKIYDSLDDLELTRRVLEKYPDYRPHVRLSALPVAAVSFNEDVDFNAPLPTVGVEGFKSIDFKAFDESDLSLPARVAAGAARIGGANMQPGPSPLLRGKKITATVTTDGRLPSRDELSDAMLRAMGASAVGQRFRAEMGRPLATPLIGDEELQRGYDPKTKTYSFEVSPTHAEVRLLNAYGRGGLKAAQEESDKINAELQAENDRFVQGRDTVRDVLRRLGYDPDEVSEGEGPIAKGFADAGMGLARLMNNFSAVAGKDARSAARDAEFIEEAAASIPEEKSGVGNFVRGVSGVAANAPKYIAAGPGAAVVAFTENLHRGQEKAIEEGLKIGAAGGVAHGTAQAVQGMNPVAQQIIARNMSGATNVVTDKLSGSERSAFESFLEGALLPTGVKAAKRYKHPVLGEMEALADQSGVGRGWVRVKTADGEVGVVRLPNAQGEGGVTNMDGSRPTRRRGEQVLDFSNVMRATQTAYDMSGLGRQSIALAMGHPIKAARAAARSVPAFFSESKAAKLQHEIDSSPHAGKRRDAGLYLADYHYSGQSLLKGEEGFQSSISHLIPGVRGSERGYNALINKLRSDVFDSYADTHPTATPETFRGVADFINKATGRGSLGRLEGGKIETILNQAFYSPRFQLSRVQLPLTAFRGTPEARRYAAGELLKFVGAGVSMMTMAHMAGLDIGMNPLSSDFGKIKIGNTRISIWGGNEVLARYTAQLVTGKATELESGRTVDRSPAKTALQFLRTRLSPQVAVPLDTALGSTAVGDKASIADDWHSGLARRAFMPLAWRDIEDAVADDLASGGNGWGGALRGSPSLLGFGASTIRPKSPEERLEQEFTRLRSKPESAGLSSAQLKHNARVNLEKWRLMKLAEDADLTDEQRERFEHAINSRFYYALVRGADDRRELRTVERVFTERLKGADDDLRKRIEALKK